MNQSETPTVVIVGAGQAGAETASELRKQNFAGRIVLIGDEPHLPYKRPPLSKAYFSGTINEDALHVMPRALMDKAHIEFLPDRRVEAIDRAGRRVQLAGGESLAYDKLVLATGGRARDLPGASGSNVFALRGIADVQAIRACCAPGRRLVIIGGGFIGLEVAAVATKLGMHVTLLEGLPRVLARVTVPEVSAFFERVHREAGVDLRTAAKIEGFEGAPAVSAVRLGDGTRVEADLVIVGIGQLPNVELAQAAGLTVDNGITVDEYARTDDPDIYAVGDCSNHPNAFLGRRARLESVQNAMEQARAAARSIAGKPETYNPVPWFWSDQYDLKLQMVGISTGFDQLVLRGDPATQRNFAAFYLREGRLLAADAVSRPQEFMFAKKLVAENAVVDPAKLADESVPMKSLMPA